MNASFFMLAEKITQTIVIPDNNEKGNLMVWGGILLLILILYLAAGLIHDIRRDEKIERLRKENESKKEVDLGDDIENADF